MRRSVYSVVGHSDTSGLDPINLVKRALVIALVIVMALLGTAAMAGAAALAAPTVVSAGTGAATVTFVADGTATLYTVTSTPGSGTCTVSLNPAPTGSQHCTVSGLTDGKSYTFHVTPSGNGTTSLVSAESAAFVPSAFTAPLAPNALVVLGGINAVVVSWLAPTSTGGSPITSYVASTVVGNATISCTVAPSSTPVCTIGGLLDGTAYTVSVVAKNAVGTSVAVTGSATTDAAIIPAPVSLHATSVTGSAVAGKTVTVGISGEGFYGQPKITSSIAGTTAVVSNDNGNLLIVRVMVKAGTPKGQRTFTIRLANGKSCRVSYRQN